LHSPDPADYLELFIDDEVVELLVTETNRYAEEKIDEMIAEGRMKRHSRAKKWKEVYGEEMKRFMGLMFITGIIKKPDLEMYWSVDEVIATPFFGKTMTRDRFKAIWSFFHTANNNENNGQDRLFKVRKLMEMISKRFRENFTPGQHISIDEGMLKWRGRLSFR
jgi:hypothetical protein